MGNYRVISSDDHVFEPVDLWTTRLEPNLRDRGPRIVRREDGQDWWGSATGNRSSARDPGRRQECGSRSRRSCILVTK